MLLFSFLAVAGLATFVLAGPLNKDISSASQDLITTSKTERGALLTCQNSQCWDHTYSCSTGDLASVDLISEAIEYYCNQHDGYVIEGGDWYDLMDGLLIPDTKTDRRPSTTVTAKDGTLFQMEIHNLSPDVTFVVDPDTCIWSFSSIPQNCSQNAAGDSAGGYSWYYFKDLTWVIGVNGNAPTCFDDSSGGACGE